ncbi:MAG: hypothetical protein R6V85_11825 [Polyangia bacterium]
MPGSGYLPADFHLLNFDVVILLPRFRNSATAFLALPNRRCALSANSLLHRPK